MKLKTSYLSFLFNYLLIFLGLFAIIVIFVYLGNPFSNFTIITLLPIAIILGILLLIEEIVYQRLRTYEINKSGIIERFVFFSKKEKFIPYQNISEINLKKNVIERLLNIGNLEIVALNGNITIRGIRNPEKIYKQIISRTKIDKDKNKE